MTTHKKRTREGAASRSLTAISRRNEAGGASCRVALAHLCDVIGQYQTQQADIWAVYRAKEAARRILGEGGR